MIIFILMLEKLLKHNFASKLLFNFKIKMTLSVWTTHRDNIFSHKLNCLQVYSYTTNTKFNGIMLFETNNILKTHKRVYDKDVAYALLKR